MILLTNKDIIQLKKILDVPNEKETSNLHT